MPAAAVGVYLRSTIRPADDVMISSNRFAGNLLAAVFFGATQPFNQVSLIGNMQRGSGLALKCSASTGRGFAQPIVHASNNWHPAPPVPDAATAPRYQGCRFPVEIVAHCVWLYFRFCQSFATCRS